MSATQPALAAESGPIAAPAHPARAGRPAGREPLSRCLPALEERYRQLCTGHDHGADEAQQRANLRLFLEEPAFLELARVAALTVSWEWRGRLEVDDLFQGAIARFAARFARALGIAPARPGRAPPVALLQFDPTRGSFHSWLNAVLSNLAREEARDES